MAKVIEQYLSRHAEPLARTLVAAQPKTPNALVIPCFDEAPGWLQNLLANLRKLPELWIVLIANAPQDAPTAAIARTALMHQALRAQLQSPRNLDAQSVSGTLPNAPQAKVLLIDCCSNPIRRLPATQGVGLARKLGTDIALGLLHANADWIHQTDADVQLPSDYFDRPLATKQWQQQSVAACIFPFQHHAKQTELQARVRLYEQHMNLYVARLRYARSPYAHHALGSTLVINKHAYAAVRGFPRRNAGEDFHVLNKLAKVGLISDLPGAPVEIQARYSHRVPVGTGPALSQLEPATYRTYANDSFKLLREALAAFAELSQGKRPQLDPRIEALLAQLGLPSFLSKLEKQSPGDAQRLAALHNWFDALRTLRFIHAARAYHPDKLIGEVSREWDNSHSLEV